MVLFVFVSLFPCLLITGSLGHEPAEIFGDVRQVVEIGGVEIVCPRGNRRGAGATDGSDSAGIENHVERLATAQRDRGGVVVQVVSRLVPQQLGVIPEDVHRNPQRGQGLIFRNVQVGNTQKRPLARRNVDDRRQRL